MILFCLLLATLVLYASQKWIITFPFPIIFVALNFHILAEILSNTPTDKITRSI